MTEQEIAELRDAIGRLRNKTLPLKPVPFEMVSRLLEERARLLEALLLEPHCCGQQGVKEDNDKRDAAIAFAVAPSNASHHSP